MSSKRILFRGLPVLAGAVALFASMPASATSLAELSFEQMVDASDYIVRGTVQAIQVEPDSEGDLWTRVRVDVRTTIKGPSELDVLALDVMGGVENDRASLVGGVPRFSLQEDVLIFAERLDSGLVVPTGLRQGKYTVRIDPERGREMLVNFAPPLNRPYDARFIPDPPAGKRLFLSDLNTRIETRMREGWDGQPIPGKSLRRLQEMHGLQTPSAQEGSR